MKYKVGDKVIVISVAEHFAPERTIGEIGKIIEVDEVFEEYKVYFGKQEWNWKYYERELELIEENKEGEKTMKYKVGDKVRVREDLKGGKHYNGLYFDKAMEKYNGKICTIENCNIDCNNYTLDCTTFWRFNDEMIEKIEEERNKFQKGDKVRVIKNGKCGIISNLSYIASDYTENGILNQNYKVSYNGNNKGDYDFYSCLELRLIERKQPILDEVEMKYLKAVIKPFKKYVNYIEKVGYDYTNNEYIKIEIRKKGSTEAINLPYFEKDSMYKNMKSNKKYNLNELDLI